MAAGSPFCTHVLVMSRLKLMRKTTFSKPMDLDIKMQELRFSSSHTQVSGMRSCINMVKLPLHWMITCGPLFFHVNDTSLRQLLLFNKFVYCTVLHCTMLSTVAGNIRQLLLFNKFVYCSVLYCTAQCCQQLPEILDNCYYSINSSTVLYCTVQCCQQLPEILDNCYCSINSFTTPYNVFTSCWKY